MASNSINDANNEAVSFQAMMTDLSKIESGTSNLPQDRQLELIDTLQTQLNDMLVRLRMQVSATANQTASGAYWSFQQQDSDWEDINLHDGGTSGSGASSFGNMSSYSAASTISVGSNSSRRRRPSSLRVTSTTSSVSNVTSVQGGPSITEFVRAICDSIKSLWLQARQEGQGNICKTMFYFLINIVMSFFGGTGNPSAPGNRPSMRYVIPG